MRKRTQSMSHDLNVTDHTQFEIRRRRCALFIPTSLAHYVLGFPDEKGK